MPSGKHGSSGLSYHCFSGHGARKRGSNRSPNVYTLPCSWKSNGIQGKDQPASNLLIKTPIGLEESNSDLRTAQRQAVPNHRTAYHRKWRRRGKCNSLLGVQINGSQRAILPASPHTLPANCQENWQEREKDRAEDYLQAPILKLRNLSTWLLGLLHTEPTRGQNAVWNTKQRSTTSCRPKPLNLPTTLFMTNKVEQDVRFYDCRISICLNYTVALLQVTHTEATLKNTRDQTNPTRKSGLACFVLHPVIHRAFFFFSPRQRGRRKVFEFKLPGNTIIYVQGEKNIQECQAQALGTCVAEAVVACGAFSSSLSTLLSLFESRQASRQGPGCTKGHCPLGSRERITLSEASQYESTKNE